jgi:hypothetical protein
MHEEMIERCITTAGRVEDLAEAALDRAEDNPVLQTLLTEIREKAGAIFTGLHEVEVRS